jgi:hypothetical protein
MLELLALTAAANRQVASQPVNELVQRLCHPTPATYEDALIFRNELLVESRGLDQLQRLIDTRLEILHATINQSESDGTKPTDS